MDNSFQNSTIAQIIDAIINQLSFEGESRSDVADILLSILNQTPYEKEPDSVIAELFIKLKAKIEGESFEPFDKSYIGNIAEIIKSILDETEYNNAPNSRIAELLLELKDELEAYVEKTANGAIANFTTSLALPLVSCEVAEGATKVYQRGANLWNEQWEQGSFDTTTGEKVTNTNLLRSINPIPVKPNFTFMRVIDQSLGFRVFYYDKNMSFISTDVSQYTQLAITTPSNCYFMNIAYQKAISKVSINYPSTDTEYHAYNANSDDYDVADIGNINTLVGVNNIFTDNGDVSVTYKAKETD